MNPSLPHPFLSPFQWVRILFFFSTLLVLPQMGWTSEEHAPKEEPHAKKKESSHTKEKSSDSHSHQEADKHSSHAEAHSETHSGNEEHGHEPPIPQTASADELLQILKDQIDQQPIEILRSLVDEIITKVSPNSPQGYEAISLLRKAFLMMAHHAIELNNHGEAIFNFERWRSYRQEKDETDPQVAAVLIDLGREYRAIGSSLTAIETFYRAMTYARQSSADPSVLKFARWEVAETTYLMKNWDRARRLYEMFIDSDGDNDYLKQSAYYRIGDCWRAMGEENEMILSYQQGIANNSQHPYTPEARLALIDVFLKRGNYKSAMQVLNDFSMAASRMSPELALFWKRRSGETLFRFLLENHNFDIAFKILEDLEKMDPDSKEWQQQIVRWKGMFYIEKGHWEKAVSALTEEPKKTEASSPAPEATPTPAVPAAAGETPQAPVYTLTNQDFRDLCRWVEGASKRKEFLGLPTPTSTP